MSVLALLTEAQASGDLLSSARENIAEWLQADYLPGYVAESIEALIEAKEWTELNDRFYKHMAFGTGGIRGRTMGKVVTQVEQGVVSEQGTPAHPAVGTNALNDFQVIRATMGLFRYVQGFLDESNRYEVPKLVIAHDVRHFSRHFCELAASTWTRLGGLALMFAGPRSTPQLSFSVRALSAHAGVVLTASHNPSHDNGFKAYFEDGAQMVSPHAEGVVDCYSTIALRELVPFLEKDLAEVRILDTSWDAQYQQSIQETVLAPAVVAEAAPKIVFSAIHGTGGVVSVPAMQALGVSVLEVPQQAVMDPRFPTVKSPNPENADALAQAVELAQAEGADALVATDPDADRMGVAVPDSNGKMVLLTGNMIGSLLAEYRIQALKDAGLLPAQGTESAVLIKTFVTTPLQAAIAQEHGLKVVNTLTGFKWIGAKLKQYEDVLAEAILQEQGLVLDYDALSVAKRRELLLQYSSYYVFGGEESYGYLASDAVRDKDANAAVLIFCELVAALKAQGTSVLEYLDGLYLKYGFYQEHLINLVYEGAEGASRIQNILQSYRQSPPKVLGEVQVDSFQDFGRDTVVDADGDTIPSQDFYHLQLSNGYSFAVRGSGTEPKIKFYLFAREDVESASDLAAVKESTQECIAQIAAAIQADAEQRSEG